MMKHPKKAPARILAAALAAVMITSSVQIVTHAADETGTTGQEQQISSFQYTYPKEHTFEEINQYFVDHPYDVTLEDKYDVQPDIANEEINTRIGTDGLALYGNDAQKKADREALVGKLSQETLDNALNASNFMRYSAGLQLLYIHTNDLIGGYQWRAQASSAILAELGVITHDVNGTVAKAAGIADGVFGWAKAGPGGSNIVAGYGVANKIVNSFMPDVGNDKTGLSHRSYILNPGLSGTGFGAARLNGTTNKSGNPRGSAVSMFVTYYGTDPDGINAVMWPGNRQPIETFLARGLINLNYPADNPYQGNPWSFFFNVGTVDTSTLKVTLECDGKQTEVLDYSNLTATEKANNRLFTIKSAPLRSLVAWRPYNVYTSGDKVHVTIEGIVDDQKLPIPVEYDVHFFETGTTPYPNLEQESVSRTTEAAAEIRYTSDYAGKLRYLVLDADQTAPTADEVLAGTELDLRTDPASLDLTALTGSGAKKLYYISISISTTGTGKDYTTASKSGEMSAVKSIDIPEYTTAPVSYTVSYDWGTDFPAGKTLPVNGSTYQSEDEAKAAVDTQYTSATTVEGKKDGKDGTWKFSGWTAALDGTTVKFTGSWSFTETAKVDAATPAAITLVSASYEVGATAAALNGATSVSDSGTITYQWYRANAVDDFTGTPIDGETGETFVPGTDAEGTYYYYVIATNTLESATGNKTASTVSNMATITVTAPTIPVTYTVVYDWGNEFPAGETLPVNSTVYQTEDEAKAAVDTKYTAGYTVKAQKDGKDGTWTFSGWNAAVEGTTVKFTGSWIFAEDTPAPVVTPSYSIKAEDTANGKLTLSTSRAARGRTVTITVTPDEGFLLASLTVRDGNGNEIAITKTSENKYTFRMPGRSVTVSAEFAPEAKEPVRFADVKESDWFYDAVQWATENGITTGSGGDLFEPYSISTRAQMVTFLWRAAGSPEVSASEHSFADIDPAAYYYKAVLWAIEQGITVGTSAETFSPDATVTRAQAVTFLARAAKVAASDGSSRFTDVADGAWYAAAVNWADDNGITNGVGGGKFGPEADCSRAEIVTFLYRIYSK